MSDRDTRSPARTLQGPSQEIFPGPFAALLLTLASIFATALVVTMLDGVSFIASVGIGQAVGLGVIGTLAARRVPEPQRERIGLRGFDPRILVSLVALLPVVIVVSELDNWIRVVLPPAPEAEAMREQLAELAKIDSVFAAVETVIVAVGINPVVEGFFFFGVMLQGVVAALGRARGVLLTAILYSLVHFPASGTPGDAIVPLASALTTGLLLCLARLASGSILPPMLLAGALAALHLTAAATSEILPIAGFNAPGDHSSPWVVVPSAVAVLYGLWALRVRMLLASFAAAPAAKPPDGAEDED